MNVPCNNTIIWFQSIGHNFEDYFTKGHKDTYELLCAWNAYDKIHPSGTENTSIGCGRPLKSAISIYSLESPGCTILFINNLHQFFVKRTKS